MRWTADLASRCNFISLGYRERASSSTGVSTVTDSHHGSQRNTLTFVLRMRTKYPRIYSTAANERARKLTVLTAASCRSHDEAYTRFHPNIIS